MIRDPRVFVSSFVYSCVPITFTSPPLILFLIYFLRPRVFLVFYLILTELPSNYMVCVDSFNRDLDSHTVLFGGFDFAFLFFSYFFTFFFKFFTLWWYFTYSMCNTLILFIFYLFLSSL